MQKTKFERVETGNPGIVVFRISGKLGFHENLKVEQLTEECLKRDFQRVIFDFSELNSLGGGVAKILRNFIQTVEERGHQIGFIITKKVILEFLQDEQTEIATYSSLEEAYQDEKPPSSRPAKTGEEVPPAEEGRRGEAEPGPVEEKGEVKNNPDVILMAYDGMSEASPAAEGDSSSPPVSEHLQEESEPIPEEGILADIFGSEKNPQPPAWLEDPTSPFDALSNQSENEENDSETLNRKLKRRILELKTLFSISADFNAIRDKKKLLDIFLLTSIAQGGVESAAFFEKRGEYFEPIICKGMDEHDIAMIKLTSERVGNINGTEVMPLDLFPCDTDGKNFLRERGFEYICPFNHKDGTSGLVMLGKRIAGRGMKKEDFEFLKILVNIARGAYQNAVMMEHENERTLGIVKTLISLIEENTLLKGTSEFVSRYVGMVAKDMNYQDEYFKDLVYGTVLRDMGMIKVSDLIVRSPRELTKEEWGIIKKHPEDGAEMLRRMKFNDHVVEIVVSHHERLNGEGYPRGLRGKEICLGARIISVVESYAAMIHERPNRSALSAREALDILKENYGIRYDREVTNSFIKIMEREIAKSVHLDVSTS
ncbi:MAG: HD domain-containing protein [Candidatus Krumholzibacteriota bacterium]|nr:HD domain-containing protein [Candidatus Krumholzibacteriota bacterium]